MKKILLMLLVLPLFVACGDDDDDLVIKANFKGEDIVKFDGKSGGYYIARELGSNEIKYSSNIPYLERDGKGCDARYEDLGNEEYDAMHLFDSKTYYYSKTAAAFDYNTGEPLNEEAKGDKLLIYNITYDAKTDTYRAVSQ